MALITIMYLLYVLPADMAYLCFYRATKWIKFAFDIIMTVSVIVNFSVGYWDKENMSIVLQPKEIARQLAGIQWGKALNTRFFIQALYSHVFRLGRHIMHSILYHWGALFVALVRLGYDQVAESCSDGALRQHRPNFGYV